MTFTKEEYIINQRIYKNIDRRTKNELVNLQSIIEQKYNWLFSDDCNLSPDQFTALERRLYKIDKRIRENIQKWR